MNRIIPESLPPALELFDALLAADLADDRPLAALTLLSVVPVLSQSAGRTKSDQNHRRHCRVVTHARKDEPAFVHAPRAPRNPLSVPRVFRYLSAVLRFLKRQIRTSIPENFRSNRKFENEGQNKHQKIILEGRHCFGYRNLTLETSSTSSQSSAVASPGPAKCCADTLPPKECRFGANMPPIPP